MPADNRNSQAYRPPVPKIDRDKVRQDFDRYCRGWDARMRGERRRPSNVWNVAEANLFREGWDAADAQERDVYELVKALGEGV